MDVLKPLHNKKAIDKTVYNKLSPSGSRLGVMYCLPKVLKKCINGSPPFRPILSELLHIIQHSFFYCQGFLYFSEDIRSQDQNLYIASLDVDSLFTNLPLDETIYIYVSLLFKDSDVVNGLTKDDVHTLLNIATKESFFMFDKCYYKQTDGVAMASPLGPALANILLCHHEKLCSFVRCGSSNQIEKKKKKSCGQIIVTFNLCLCTIEGMLMIFFYCFHLRNILNLLDHT